MSDIIVVIRNERGVGMASVDGETALRDYRLRVWSYCEDLQRETDPLIRANTALYLAEAATALARLEMDEAHKVSQTEIG